MDPPSPTEAPSVAGGTDAALKIVQSNQSEKAAPSDGFQSSCLVCQKVYDDSVRTGTHYKGHCQNCSLDLRNIRKACGEECVEGKDEEKGPQTIKVWLADLCKNNIDEYRAVFERFRKQTSGVTGRGKKKAEVSSGSIVQFRESDEDRQRQKQKAGFEAMTCSRYCQYFTGQD